MRKVWLGIVGAVVCLGLGLAVVGCDSSKGVGKDKMQGDKMGADKMAGDKMGGEKMGTDKMSGEAKDKK
jgi:pentapeptide MXKDX repeat protein